MKVQILTLDEHDDRNTVLDRLGWVQAQRVALVWPPSGSPLRTTLDLRLVQRRARNRRVQLGLVSLDPAIRASARELGIPVFDTPDSMPEREWRRRTAGPRPGTRREPRPEPVRKLRPPRPSSSSERVAGLRRGVLFTTALLALASTLVVCLPSATVVVTPSAVSETRQLEVLIGADPDLDGGTPALGAVRRAVRVSGEIRLATSGVTRIPADYARGTVVFSNLTGLPIEIPAGTGLRAGLSDPVRFLTTEAVRLPAGAGATSEVPLIAADPGSAGNLPSGQISAVEGELGLLVTVTQPEPTAGGTEAPHAAVAAADLADAYDLLLEQLETQALDELRELLAPGEAIAASSLRVSQEYSRSYDAAPGEPADTLGLDLDVMLDCLAYREDDLESMALTLFADDDPGRTTVPGSLSIRLLAEPTTDRLDRTTARVEIRRLAAPEFPAGAAIAAIAGRPIAVAADRLTDDYSLSRPPGIRLNPSFFPWLPFLPARISLHVDWQAAG